MASQPPGPPPAPGTLSPDGRYIWNGAQWVPNVPVGTKKGHAFRNLSLGCLGLIVLLVIVVALASTGSKNSTSPTGRSGGSVNTTRTPATRSASSTAFADVALSGTGDDLVKVPASVGNTRAVAVITGNSSENFIVEPLDSNNATLGVLVNTIGKYSGTVGVNFGSFGADSPAQLKITSKGPWSITIEDASKAPTFSTTTSGHGDMVIRYTGRTGSVSLTNSGSANFIVTEEGDDNIPNPVVNTIGKYSGKQAISGGDFVLIKSDGDWTVSAS